MEVNGKKREGMVEPRLLLVHFLREHLGLTGTHVGCDTTNCGACGILLDGKAVKSCSIFAVQVDGRSLTTIEGVADHESLHPIQLAFWEKHGLQCGFCTPGIIMSAYQLLESTPDPDESEIRRALSGNLCRCTGYVKVIESVKYAARLKRNDKKDSAENARRRRPTGATRTDRGGL